MSIFNRKNERTKKIQNILSTALDKANSEYDEAKKIIDEIKEENDVGSHQILELAHTKQHEADVLLADELNKIAQLLKEGKVF